MKKTILTAGTALCLSALATASDITLSIESGGAHIVDAFVGSQVDYKIWAELSDNNNEGLALLCFDLTYTGGALAQANAPTGATQLNFATPLGINNPAGFGGTPTGGNLVQVGGAQNTIKNTFAAIPTGSVITGVGANGARVLFASGTLDAPASPGSYTLDATQVVANVVRLGETGTGEFWAVDKAGVGGVTGLIINVVDCAPVTYCAGKVNSDGCTPSIGSTGTSSLGGADDFHVTASNVVGARTGLMFFGGAPASIPFFGGQLCVAGPHERTVVQNSGGSTGTPCSGSYDYHFTQAQMMSSGFLTGSKVYAQYWYRDPAHVDGTGVGLTNGLEVTICP
jgi:hypothetical protein